MPSFLDKAEDFSYSFLISAVNCSVPAAVICAPVLTLEEAPKHPHNRERGTYLEIEGVAQLAPAPRLSRSVAPAPKAFRPWQREEAAEILAPWLSGAALAEALSAAVID